ncbi:MAG TPA: EamA family transporter [Thermoanaerobaculia bacterium]|nr:EamA family transporter [Thermoanaerobaculia bacterium]
MMPSRPALIAAFAAVYVFWGATFLAIRYAVVDIPPLLVIAARCLFGGAILFAWILWKRDFTRPTFAQIKTAAIAGTCLFLGCHAVLAYAEQRVTSGQAALYMTGIPLWLVALDAIRARRTPPARVIAGMLLGCAGVALLADLSNALSGTLFDRIALIASTFFWAAGSIYARDGARPPSSAQSAAMQLVLGGIVVFIVSIALGESPSPISVRAGVSLAFLIVCGTVFAFAAFTWLLRVTTPAAVGSYAFVNPIIALALAWSAGDEPMTWRTLVAGLLVISAIVLTRPRVAR